MFIEDYDINVARYLVQGVDVWLNNPRRPLEASGTSGMKVCGNGGMNLSVLDGWWVEGYKQGNGWAIGAGEEYADLDLPGRCREPRHLRSDRAGDHSALLYAQQRRPAPRLVEGDEGIHENGDVFLQYQSHGR